MQCHVHPGKAPPEQGRHGGHLPPAGGKPPGRGGGPPAGAVYPGEDGRPYLAPEVFGPGGNGQSLCGSGAVGFLPWGAGEDR